MNENETPKERFERGKFSSENQPSREAQTAANRRNGFKRHVIRRILDNPVPIKPDSELAKNIEKVFGKEAMEMYNTGELMVLAQVNKALSGDTSAFNSVIDHGIGKAVQAVANTNADGEDVQSVSVVLPPGTKFDFPSNTEGNPGGEPKPDTNEQQ